MVIFLKITFKNKLINYLIYYILKNKKNNFTLINLIIIIGSHEKIKIPSTQRLLIFFKKR